MTRDKQVDIAIVSDLRLPGGTTSSIAAEVRAQSDRGLSTALVHVPSSLVAQHLPLSPHIEAVSSLPGVSMVTREDSLHARLLVIRHPIVAASTPKLPVYVSGDYVLLVANHPADDAAGQRQYDVRQITERIRHEWKVDPLWAPIGPVVRESVISQINADPTFQLNTLDHDWWNIFTPPEMPERTSFLSDKPIIGRHSRPHKEKWPSTRREMLSAYPRSGSFQVEILGGVHMPGRFLRKPPRAWNVVEFGAEDPWSFVQRIDFWVYVHHSAWKEAFGRAPMEALAAGCVAILPPYMEALYGDAALYGEAHEVQSIIAQFWKDEPRFVEQSHKAQRFAQRFSPEMHIDRIGAYGITASDSPRVRKDGE